ncbi:MAG: pyruvate kinase, partial [Alloprevotella sp.]|nr:pyruvate kinase [Alloprevotella sp.]
EVEGDETRVSVNYKGLVQDLSVGDRVLVNNGLVVFEVEELKGSNANCVCLVGGDLSNRKSMSFPNKVMSGPFLSEADKKDLLWGIQNDVDFVAASFVSTKQDVLDMRNFLNENGGEGIEIIAKIENQSGVDNIERICEACEGIMVARGDLGIEVPQERIPGIQRRLVDKAIRAHKPVIVATQMLQSMIHNPRPTRTEVTDIANAVYSRADALMLSGETAYGDYPVEAVNVMATIAQQAEEESFREFGDLDIPLSPNPDVTEFFSKEAVMATKTMKLRAIIMDSYTGRTARYVSSFRGKCNILAICYKAKTVRHLALSYGVYAIYMPMKSYGHEFLLAALRKLLSDNMLRPEDRICYLGSQRKEQRTSFMEMNIVKNLFETEGEETYPN